MICPETKEEVSGETCESSCDDTGCKYIKTCEEYQKWKMKQQNPQNC